jgi:hypothetical protein
VIVNRQSRVNPTLTALRTGGATLNRGNANAHQEIVLASAAVTTGVVEPVQITVRRHIHVSQTHVNAPTRKTNARMIWTALKVKYVTAVVGWLITATKTTILSAL